MANPRSPAGSRLPAMLALMVALAMTPSVRVGGEEPERTLRDEFPARLVRFEPARQNPVFTEAGPGHWDAKIRERGWILRDDEGWHLWYTGYDGTREGIKLLGYARSKDGLSWTRDARNPLVRDLWVEDMMVVKQGETWYMFAEGLADRAQLLTSQDRVQWTRRGQLQIRKADGSPLDDGPYGTPTVWQEGKTWRLFYERRDAGVWLARPVSDDLLVWQNVQDEPVLKPGPDEFDRKMIALNQIIRDGDRYYAYFHGSAADRKPSLWAPGIAVSRDLVHWTKYPGNPLRPISENKSSGIVVTDGKSLRFYTMHGQVDAWLPATTQEK